ncbi:MAG TPA: TonB-dependent receptor [Sphingomicrobium sp.]|nr:TonB-dependent receptor [Sphingomicrobium sp.]
MQPLARIILLASAAVPALIAAPAAAQENPATSPELVVNQETEVEAAEASDTEIVVTARRRDEVLLDVPIAVTAYSGEQLDRQGALDITDIGDTTPNVTLETSRGTNTTLTAFIRGVGQQDPVAGFEQGVGIYLDDVYLNRPQAAVLDIYEVERIEVLRGPQGTLYGRNTIGGAIKYVTRRLSDDPRLTARANLGTHELADLILTGSTPIGSALKIGASAARLSRGGFGKNLTTGADNYNKDVWATRGTIELDPSPTAWFRLSGDYIWDNSNARGGHRLIPSLASGAPVLDDVFDSRGGLVDPEQKVKGGGLALHGEVGLNDWLKFRTITAYRKDRSETPIDFDALPAVDLDVPAIYKNRQFSQELQLVVERGPLAGVVGAYYLNANAQNVFDVRLYTTLPAVLPGLTASTEGDVDTKTWAVFGDFTYDITPQWAVSLGGRYTNDKREARVLRQTRILGGHPLLGGSQGFGVGTVIATTSNFDGKRTDTAFSPRASVSFRPTKDHNIYLSYARGFKGGGFDPRGQSSQAPSQSPEDVFEFMAFDPETVDSLELGWKASLFANRLQIATALFNADYKDVQVPGSAGCIVGGVSTFCGITTNAGKARFRGFEFEGNARLAEDMAIAGDRLNLAAMLGYLDANYREFITNIPGQGPVDVADFRKIQNTPKWTASGSLDYSTPAWGGRLYANTTLSYRSKTQQFELRTPMLDQPGFALWDANLLWRSASGRWEIGLHGKNLTDKEYIVAGYNFLAQNPLTGDFILNSSGNPIPTLGREGTLTAYYGAPRQVFVSLGINF